MIKKSCDTGRSGFTLVEVIVIAVIVAVLAIVATQLYVGYIREARLQTVTSLAEAGAAAANAYTRKTGANLTSGDTARLHLFITDPTKFKVEIVPGSGVSGKVVITEIKTGITASADY